MKSRYTLFHALLAIGVLVYAVSHDFWNHFIHGLVLGTPSPNNLLMALLAQTALFGLLVLVLWGSTFLPYRPRADIGETTDPPDRRAALRLVLIAFLPVCLVTFSLEWLGTAGLEKLAGIHLPPQELINWLQPGTYPLSVRLVLMVFAVFEAPLLEEPLFRGIIFRGLSTTFSVRIALVVSGFVFALIHVNAASFIPLWFLGCAFAELYRRTRTLLAPMTFHFLFNLLNLILCLLFPGLAT